jgi:hypothetical protein
VLPEIVISGIHRWAGISEGNQTENRMNRLHKRIFMFMTLTILLSSQSIGVQATSLPQSTTAQTSAKVAQWLKQSGFTYTKASETVWVVKSKGNILGDFETFVATNENVVVIGVVMARQKNLKMTQEALLKILKLNHDNDFVKIGIDEDNDLFVRLERKIRTLDFEEFIACYSEVILASDNVYKNIKPFLVADK